MIPELGHFAFILALLASLLLATVPLVGAQRRAPEWMALARPLAYVQCLFVLFAWACLVASFVLRVGALATLCVGGALVILPVVHALSRGASIGVMATLPAAFLGKYGFFTASLAAICFFEIASLNLAFFSHNTPIETAWNKTNPASMNIRPLNVFLLGLISAVKTPCTP